MDVVRDLSSIELAMCDLLDATDWMVLGSLIQRGNKNWSRSNDISASLHKNIDASVAKLSKLNLIHQKDAQLKITDAGYRIALST